MGTRFKIQIQLMSAPKCNANNKEHLKNNRRILSIFSKGIGGVIFFVFQFLIFAKVNILNNLKFWQILLWVLNAKSAKLFLFDSMFLSSQRHFAQQGYSYFVILKDSKF